MDVSAPWKSFAFFFSFFFLFNRGRRQAALITTALEGAAALPCRRETCVSARSPSCVEHHYKQLRGDRLPDLLPSIFHTHTHTQNVKLKTGAALTQTRAHKEKDIIHPLDPERAANKAASVGGAYQLSGALSQTWAGVPVPSLTSQRDAFQTCTF